MPRIELNGADFNYSIAGPPGGRLIILLHGGRGFGDHRSDFSAYKPLADHGDGYRVLGFDYRGHGRSSCSPPYTFAQLVDDIDAFRRHFAGEEGKAVVAGGSFGGYLAQQYAITYSNKVSHLVLRGTAPSHHHEEEALSTFAARLHKAPNASIEMVHKVFSAFEDDDEFRLIIFALNPLYVETYDADAGLKKIRDTVFRAETHNALYSEQEKYFDYRDELHKVTAKTLIVVGDQDWICPPSQSSIIAEKIQGSRLLVIPGANHSVQVEKNAEFLQAVRELLKQ
ncbi:prolyl aminopeptidase [Diplodia corticola]|uniref:Prolyl aminopeptidase n=1 Tax=Diplodia corticola TaxID=236234 RepID=A0A1J9RLM6_9PEZI|nr:prolyl aminopeptidase [Diplodia corticola]OJD28828.1 prolyl aminopeptidase [Diplodia corticola]